MTEQEKSMLNTHWQLENEKERQVRLEQALINKERNLEIIR